MQITVAHTSVRTVFTTLFASSKIPAAPRQHAQSVKNEKKKFISARFWKTVTATAQNEKKKIQN